VQEKGQAQSSIAGTDVNSSTDQFLLRRLHFQRVVHYSIETPVPVCCSYITGRPFVGPLALGTALTPLAFDHELIRLSFCKANDVATLRHKVYANEHPIPQVVNQRRRASYSL
jgi:hypothetical protein